MRISRAIVGILLWLVVLPIVTLARLITWPLPNVIREWLLSFRFFSELPGAMYCYSETSYWTSAAYLAELERQRK